MARLFRWAAAAATLLLVLTFSASEYSKPGDPGPPPDLSEPIALTPEELRQPPNIIIVLSEAFWDPTQLPGLQFSRDPIPFFHSLQKSFPHGTMLSPMFGGGTANVELEVLTGLSYRFFPPDSVVYEQYIKQPTPSLATILSAQGYKATAIAPFHQWFFTSTDVYRYLGFSRFIPLEFFNPDEFVGPYMGDAAVARRITEESERSPGPDFIFANTMENHYHYYPGKFKRNTIDVKGDGVSAETIGLTETLAQGMSGADRMLQSLVSHYSTVREPTIIVFFGDHLPSLEKYNAYVDTGYISGPDDPDFLEKMYHVPLVIWNNYMPRGEAEKLHMSPSFLGPHVLKMAGREGSDYTDYLGELSKKLPVLPPAEHYARYGIDPALAGEYARRQAEQFAEAQRLAPQRSEGTFELGYGQPRLQDITTGGGSRSERHGPLQLTLEGGRFGLGCTVFVDGQAVPTTWRSESTLQALVPRELIGGTGTLAVQIKVLDSKENVLAVSETLSFPAQRH
ncbi:LTA synthase family protein [Paenibacillus mucilaginosus]|uniref:Cyclic beta-1,2-glucan modification transmembrane protein n=1 Tax=Paenibacillus mucilaginosus (strain KNP414) TaxID=1036673 RepID=F8FAN8_PAEMK|nr:LTA synthase family protein [Paenibacillus mucilaginosus]AEI41127.1 cyclic beta-1,2-glucan modification transmembrane protein [Paenibacillus mucilaginosus KNP414]MCG7211440.1 LTA synthase family protein [Paenibacillus mucilaginosus]WDM30183.1 LTA synthase family protein [Paenibacillus mucilaginosus]